MEKMKLNDLCHYLAGKVAIYDINSYEANRDDYFYLFKGFFLDLPGWLTDYNFTVERFRAENDVLLIGCAVPVPYNCLSDLENHIDPQEHNGSNVEEENAEEENDLENYLDFLFNRDKKKGE